MDIERINNLLDRKQQNIEKIEILVNEVSMLYKTRPKAGNQKVVDLILQQLTLLVNSNFVLPQKAIDQMAVELSSLMMTDLSNKAFVCFLQIFFTLYHHQKRIIEKGQEKMLEIFLSALSTFSNKNKGIINSDEIDNVVLLIRCIAAVLFHNCNALTDYHKIVIETIANASSKICKIISINQNRTINESKLTESKQFNNANEKKTSKDESTDSTKEEGVISMQELSVMCAATSCVNTLTYCKEPEEWLMTEEPMLILFMLQTLQKLQPLHKKMLIYNNNKSFKVKNALDQSFTSKPDNTKHTHSRENKPNIQSPKKSNVMDDSVNIEALCSPNEAYEGLMGLHCKTVECCMVAISNSIINSRSFPTTLVDYLMLCLQLYIVYKPTTSNNAAGPLSTKLEQIYINNIESVNDNNNNMNNNSNNNNNDVSPCQKTPNKKGGKLSTKKNAKKKNKHKKPQSKEDEDSENDELKLDEEFYVKSILKEEQKKSTRLTKSLKDGKKDIQSVRVATLSCLQFAIKVVDKRVMLGYWVQLLPDSPTRFHNYPLFEASLLDHHHRVRLEALSVLRQLTEGSKQLLMAAGAGSNMAFTSFSSFLEACIKQLHRCVWHVLMRERVYVVLTQAIKLLNNLFINTPYQKVEAGLLTSSLGLLKPLLSCYNIGVQVPALNSLHNVILSQTDHNEVVAFINGAPFSGINSSFTGSNKSINSKLGLSGTVNTTIKTNDEWLYCLCESLLRDAVTPRRQNHYKRPISSLHTSPPIMSSDDSSDITSSDLTSSENEMPSLCGLQAVPVRLEALRILSVLSLKHFGMLRKHMTRMHSLMIHCLCDPSQFILLYAAKWLESLSTSMSIEGETASAFKLWSSLLENIVPTILTTCPNITVKTAMVQALGCMGELVFNELPNQKHIFLISIIIGLSSSSTPLPSLKSSFSKSSSKSPATANDLLLTGALEALSKFVCFKLLLNDPCFVADVVLNICKACNHSNINVVLKATLALNNLSDHAENILEETSREHLITACIIVIHKHDKARAKSLRCLGNLLSCASVNGALLNEACATINKYICNSLLKVRWNACYSLGKLLKNKDINLIDLPPGLMKESFELVIKTLKTANNTKVKMSAIWTLCVLQDKDILGGLMLDVMECLWCLLISVGDDISVPQEVTLAIKTHQAFYNLLSMVDEGEMHAVAVWIQKEGSKLKVNKVLEWLGEEAQCNMASDDDGLKVAAAEAFKRMEKLRNEKNSQSVLLLNQIFFPNINV